MTSQQLETNPEATEPEETPEATLPPPSRRSRRNPNPAPATDDGSASDPGFPETSDEQPEQPQTRIGSSPESSRVKDSALLRKGISIGVSLVTRFAHQVVARDAYARHVGLLLADEQDAEEIAKPAARLVARKFDIPAIGGEAGDLVELITAVGNYIDKQVDRFFIASALRRNGAFTPEHQADLTGEPEPAQAEPEDQGEPMDGQTIRERMQAQAAAAAAARVDQGFPFQG